MSTGIAELDLRHQQYRNDLVPAAAAQAYYITKDQKWIRKNLPLLVECADWTIANRKKTMSAEAGERSVSMLECRAP